ncbi:Uncharacterised protein [Yersinia aleksiciae]|uniref:Uncharacterized protein n=1 Tax=Yersinia aleksiciae TaxID=263819 RepID=A0A0T9UQP2_YERAE|nr:Uncharacterised protein [Yersinia aleksiciae]
MNNIFIITVTVFIVENDMFLRFFYLNYLILL